MSNKSRRAIRERKKHLLLSPYQTVCGIHLTERRPVTQKIEECNCGECKTVYKDALLQHAKEYLDKLGDVFSGEKTIHTCGIPKPALDKLLLEIHEILK